VREAVGEDGPAFPRGVIAREVSQSTVKELAVGIALFIDIPGDSLGQGAVRAAQRADVDIGMAKRDGHRGHGFT
jgi:hypothetical protein